MDKTLVLQAVEAIDISWENFERGHDKTASLKMQEAVVLALLAIFQELEAARLNT